MMIHDVADPQMQGRPAAHFDLHVVLAQADLDCIECTVAELSSAKMLMASLLLDQLTCAASFQGGDVVAGVSASLP